MRPPAHVQATIELLDQLDQTRTPADRLMAGYFKQRRYIGSKDKAAISENFYSVLRQRLSLQWLLEQAGLTPCNRLLLALLKSNEGDSIKALFDGEKFSPVRLRSEEIDALTRLQVSILESAPKHVRLNVPAWLTPKLEAVLGDRFEIEMAATNQRATTDVRVNTLKASIDELLSSLQEAGYVVQPTDLSPWGIRFKQRVSLFGLDSFKRGWFEIQDEGSQLLALLTGVTEGQKAVDFCAGAGGKTLAMAAMMKNKGILYACDVHSKRMQQLSLRSKRAGVHNVRTHVLSSEQDKWVKKHAEVADVVLVDAPCSGTGTWRRSPDSRWNLTPENLNNLVALQASILRSASRLVKPGGTLWYATCSLLQEENEDQIEQFLEENTLFSRSAVTLPESMRTHRDRFQFTENSLRTFPALSGTDGFFAAALLRSKD